MRRSDFTRAMGILVLFFAMPLSASAEQAKGALPVSKDITLIKGKAVSLFDGLSLSLGGVEVKQIKGDHRFPILWPDAEGHACTIDLVLAKERSSITWNDLHEPYSSRKPASWQGYYLELIEFTADPAKNQRVMIRVTKLSGETYRLEDRILSAEEFLAFLKILKEEPHTWSCAETAEGGITRYEARDAAGALYEYRSESVPGRTETTVRRNQDMLEDPFENITFRIEAKKVTPAVFNARLNSLKESDGSFFCERKPGGGTSGFDLRDAAGASYEYRAVSENGKTNASLVRAGP